MVYQIRYVVAVAVAVVVAMAVANILAIRHTNQTVEHRGSIVRSLREANRKQSKVFSFVS